MRTIERYVFGSFLSSFLLAFMMLSFVLTIGLLVQIVDFVMDGVPMSLVGEFCMVSLPETLQWSAPLALLVSSILTFSRMSADSEIAAMRACGVNLLSVVRWPVLFAGLCTLLGFWVNNQVVPRGHEIRRSLKTRVSVETGLSVLEPGRVIDDFPKVKLYFGRKEGNWLYDLVVLDYSTPGIDRMITADKALVRQEGTDATFELYHMTVDPIDEKNMAMGRANRFVYKIPNIVRVGRYKKRAKDFRFRELCARIRAQAAEVEKISGSDRMAETGRRLALGDLSSDRVELSKRLVFAMASLCFVLVGIPLGIRSQRRESSVGMAISLAVSLGYYVLVILMMSCDKAYAVRPDLLIWLPVLLCCGLAAHLIRRHL
ncbi:MAG: LptF/LptG family permease [Kiritimatiellia bacterium]